jgi:hypothetical protein
MILSTIPVEELTELLTGIDDSINAIYTYRNSVMGILEMVQGDYSGLTLDAQNLQTAISDPGNLTFLKDVMTKLG